MHRPEASRNKLTEAYIFMLQDNAFFKKENSKIYSQQTLPSMQLN